MQEKLSLFPDLPVVWRLSSKWASKEIDCTLHGIRNYCGAACCKGFAYWPPKASGTGVCASLGPQGCLLGDGKPVTCLLYPFRLKGNTLVLHGRTLIPKSGYCAPCYKRGGRTIAENNHRNFELLFGKEQADAIVANTLVGKNTEIVVPQQVLDAYNAELKWEEANAVPMSRWDMLCREPKRGLVESPFKVLDP